MAQQPELFELAHQLRSSEQNIHELVLRAQTLTSSNSIQSWPETTQQFTDRLFDELLDQFRADKLNISPYTLNLFIGSGKINVNEVFDTFSGPRTLLQYYAEIGMSSHVNILINRGANVEFTGKTGMTALELAINTLTPDSKNDARECIILLLQRSMGPTVMLPLVTALYMEPESDALETFLDTLGAELGRSFFPSHSVLQLIARLRRRSLFYSGRPLPVQFALLGDAAFFTYCLAENRYSLNKDELYQEITKRISHVPSDIEAAKYLRVLCTLK